MSRIPAVSERLFANARALKRLAATKTLIPAKRLQGLIEDLEHDAACALAMELRIALGEDRG